MKKINLLLVLVFFAISLIAQTNSNYPVIVKLDGNYTNYTIDGYSSQAYAKSVFFLWQNKPHNFFEKDNRSELETQIYLESEAGKSDLEYFNKLRNRIKIENCLLEIPLSDLGPEYTVDKRKLYVMKAEDIENVIPNKIQFEEIVLDKLTTIEVLNKKITATLAWNYFYLPISDLKVAQKIEQENKDMTLRIEFRITNSYKVPNSIFMYNINSVIKKMEIVDSSSQVIWKL